MKGLAAFLVPVVMTAVLLELGLRGYERFILKLPATPSAKGVIHVASDFPGRIYKLAPDVSMEREGVHIATNSLGFRDDEPPPLNQQHGRRILVLGDSVAWGFGVDQSNAFPQTLEAALGEAAKRQGDAPPVVFNAAVDGYSTRQQVATLAEIGPELKPDVVLFAYVLNDPASAQDGGLDHYFRKEWYVQRYYRIAAERWLEFKAGDSLPDEYFHRIHSLYFRDVASELERASGFADALGAKVVLAVVPLLEFKRGQPYAWSDVHQDIGETAGQLGFEFVDLTSAFQDVDSKTVAIDILHPNQHGHALISAQLETALLPILGSSH